MDTVMLIHYQIRFLTPTEYYPSDEYYYFTMIHQIMYIWINVEYADGSCPVQNILKYYRYFTNKLLTGYGDNYTMPEFSFRNSALL